MTPLFFSNALSGYTTNSGVFASNFDFQHNQNDKLNPELIDTSYHDNPGRFTSELTIPTYVASKNSYLKQRIVPFFRSQANKLAKVNDTELYVSIAIHSLKITYSGNKSNNYVKKLTVIYEPTIWLKRNNSLEFYHKSDDNGKNSIVIKGYTPNPTHWLNKNLSRFANDFDYQNKLEQFLAEYDWGRQLCLQADYMTQNINNLLKGYQNNVDWYEKFLTNAIHYRISLDTYQSIYHAIMNSEMTDKNKTTLIAANQYLILVGNLLDLEKCKKKLPVLAKGNIENSDSYNKQQLAAITSDKALNLLQSVAGSGKSHTILGRIKYLLNNGIKPENITVLSFTNAAADHIANSVDADINSLTISKMINEIYQQNAKQILSSLPTLINSLKLEFEPQDNVIQMFIRQLEKLNQGQKQAQTRTLHFVSQYYDEVINALNKTNQTTLELEEILAYHKMKEWQDPYKTKYLIVDEVQDTSIFQFIYLLRYAAVKKTNVFFVGDASQTLYEFRNADPGALNALENSGYFTTYKLETNYRSKPGILLYANQILRSIAANKFASLRLHAPGYDELGQSKIKPNLTREEFVKEVHYCDSGIAHARDITQNNLGRVYQTYLQNYLNEKLNAHEKVAFLGYTQKSAQITKIVLKKLYPDTKIAILSPARASLFNVLSSYLYQYSNELQFIPTDNFVPIFIKALQSKLPALGIKYINAEDYAEMMQKLINDLNVFWPLQREKMVQGIISHQELIKRVKSHILSFEIDYNSQNQQYFDDKAEENAKKIKDADFIISTIHSTKGLEFDNCVVLMTDTARMTQEEKRLYYVSLTRAEKSEFIIEVSAGTKKAYHLYEDCLSNLRGE